MIDLVLENRRIRVMVVNDSRLVREYLSDIIRSIDKFELCGTARDGKEAIDKIGLIRPDVVLLDLEMPNVDGITFIERVIASCNPLPIIVVSSYGEGISPSDRKLDGNSIVFDCLDRGALDFIPIPLVPTDSGENNSDRTGQIKEKLISAIETAAKVDPHTLIPAKRKGKKVIEICHVDSQNLHFSKVRNVIIIGSSTGGPRIITEIFSSLPPGLHAAIIIVQHMPAPFTKVFARHLDEISEIRVTEARENDPLEYGTAYIAPGDYHVKLTPEGRIKLDKSGKRQGVRPSVNVTMLSAADVFGSNAIGVLLSGMGQDGAFGMKMIKMRGGKTIAQDQATSAVFGMPKAAYDIGAVDEMLPTEMIGQTIIRYVNELEKQNFHEMKQENGVQHYVG